MTGTAHSDMLKRFYKKQVLKDHTHNNTKTTEWVFKQMFNSDTVCSPQSNISSKSDAGSSPPDSRD